MAIEPRCATCKMFEDSEKDDGYGSCRRKSPKARAMQYAVNGQPMPAVWPLVRDADWCGEYVTDIRPSDARLL